MMKLIRGEYFPSSSNKTLMHYDKLYCNPNTIEDGDIIYSDTHYILKYKDILNTKKDLIIITHNSDHYVCDGNPWDSNGISVDELSCYSRWYAQNSYSEKENVFPIPIGFENTRWEEVFGPKTHWINQVVCENIEPKSLVYLNCKKDTNISERQRCYDLLSSMEFVTIDIPNLQYIDYLKRIKEHKFAISPRGNGLDCHRTWEILMMKRVPILKREGQLEELYSEMPVMFIDDWTDLNKIDLEKEYKKFSFENQKYLEFDFWIEKINKTFEF